MIKIDLVVPYVDSNDPEWQQLYNQYNPLEEQDEQINALSRFRGQGDFFKYFFRCLDKNLPWLGTVYLLVQSKTQVPDWMDTTQVHIVLHEDFIPQEYLPTFNSTCIEMFLHRIPNLSEHFLYANDDIFVIKPLIEPHFFKAGRVKTSGFQGSDLDILYGHHKVNCYCLVFNKNKEDVIRSGKVLSFSHIVRPYLKSQNIACFNKYQAEILDSISCFREEKNINVYLFDCYAIKNRKNYPNEGIYDLFLSSYTEKSAWALMFNDNAAYLNQRKINMLCIQDNSNDMNIYEDIHLNNYFKANYPNKSKYEK